MKVLTSKNIIFGDILIGYDETRVALVYEPYMIVEMTEDALDEYQGDWLDADFTGEVYIVRDFNKKELK